MDEKIEWKRNFIKDFGEESFSAGETKESVRIA